jgi:hypothetical protein
MGWSEMSDQMDRGARLQESFNFTQIMMNYSIERLTQLNAWKEEDGVKKDSLLDKHYDSRIALMLIMVDDAIEHVKSMDNLYD